MRKILSLILLGIFTINLFACQSKVTSEGKVNVDTIQNEYVKEVVGKNIGKEHKGFAIGNVYTIDQLLEALEKNNELDFYFRDTQTKEGYSVVINKYHKDADYINYIKSKVKKVTVYRYSEDYPTQIYVQELE